MADTIGTAYVQIEPSFDGVVPKIDKEMGGAGNSGGKSFSAGFGKAMAGFGAATSAAGAAIGAIGAKFVSATSDVAVYGDNIDKMSQKMGLTSEAYQEWDAVMQHSGTSMETMKASMKTLANAAETGNEAFEKIGITQKDMATMSQQDLFEATIAGLQNVTDDTQRTYLAGKLLGRGATELGALLNTSAEDTQAMRDRVRELGGVMSQDAVKASAAFQDQLQDMQTAFSGISRNMMAEFLPSMTQVMSGLTEIFSGNAEGGLSQISEGINGIVDGITQALPQLMQVAAQIMEALATAIISNLPQLTKTGFDILNQLVTFILQNLPTLIKAGVEIIGQLAQGIAQALPTLIPTIVDVVMQIVDFLIQNVPMLIDAALQLMQGLADGLIEAIPVLIGYIPQIITSLVDALVVGIPMLINGAIQLVMGIVNALPQIIQCLIDALPQIIQAICDALPVLVPALIDAAIQMNLALVAAMPQIIAALIDAVPDIIAALIQAFEMLGPALITTFTAAFDSLVPVFEQLGPLAQNAVTTIQTAFAPIGTWFKTKFTEAVNGIKNAFNTIKTYFQQKYNEIIQVFANIGKSFQSVGHNIVEGIKQGIGGTWDRLKTFVKELVGDLVSFAKKILGIESPSKVFAKEVGQWIPAGIAQGIHNGMNVLDKEMKRMTNESLAGTISATTEVVGSADFMPEAGTVSEGNSATITNYITVDGAQDPEAWTQTFIRTLKREARMA